MLLGLGSSRFARHYSGNHYCFLFLGVLRCFSSPRSRHIPMDSVYDSRALPLEGFPIRKSPGLRLFSTSPRLIAGSHVLHRLMVPRHPPYALSNFTVFYYSTDLYFSELVKNIKKYIANFRID